jgi:hypothetical protein
MFVTYKPADGDEQQWTFKPQKFPSHEAEAIEHATGWTWDEFATQVVKGSIRARRALLWILLRRQHPVIKFADIAFTTDELELEMDLDELTAMRAELDQITDDAVREMALRQIDAQIAEAQADPKADLPASANATG